MHPEGVGGLLIAQPGRCPFRTFTTCSTPSPFTGMCIGITPSWLRC